MAAANSEAAPTSPATEVYEPVAVMIAAAAKGPRALARLAGSVIRPDTAPNASAPYRAASSSGLARLAMPNPSPMPTTQAIAPASALPVAGRANAAVACSAKTTAETVVRETRRAIAAAASLPLTDRTPIRPVTAAAKPAGWPRSMR
ncbi:hypothetical protein GCM10027447_01370 [Glycomyces halotolerans]